MIVALVLVPIVLLCAVCVAGVIGVNALRSAATEPVASPTPSATASSPAPQRALAVGDCVTGTSREYVLQTCERANHRVLAVAQESVQCPPWTDVVGSDVDDQVVCLHAVKGPHPGDPGAGGGILRVGDCLPNMEVEGQVEIACTVGKAYHRITGVVTDDKYCKKPAVRSVLAEQRGAKGELVYWCLVDAIGIASPGECVAWTAKQAPSDVPVSCSKRPVFKFTGRASTSEGCLRFSSPTWYVARYDNLQHVMYNCYRKLG